MTKQEKQRLAALNREIETFVAEKTDAYTRKDLQFINQYTGYGGLVDVEENNIGILYEYYTPDSIIKLMWENVFSTFDPRQKNGIKVLEPSCGTGRFLAFCPPNWEHKGYEINKTSAAIARVNGYNVETRNFLSNFVDRTGKKKPITPTYDVVIGNPPYGAFVGELCHFEKKYTGAKDYIDYFMLRGMELLKPGGVLCFVLPKHFLHGNWNECRVSIMEYADQLQECLFPLKFDTEKSNKGTFLFDRTEVQAQIVMLRKKP
jgi:SAM-dependent methyltransferase